MQLPVMLVDMSQIFECYARETLRRWVPNSEAYEVLDGNVSGEDGGRVDLFTRFDIQGHSPAATPDLVLMGADRGAGSD